MNLGLTREEQDHVRGAAQFLRRRMGGWRELDKVLHLDTRGFRSSKTITPTLAFRLARFLRIGMEDLLAGKFPAPNTCPYCGHVAGEVETDGST